MMQKCLIKSRALSIIVYSKNLKNLDLISCLFYHDFHKILGRQELQKGREYVHPLIYMTTLVTAPLTEV